MRGVGFMPQKRLDTAIVCVYTKAVLSVCFGKLHRYMNGNKFTYAAVFDDFSDVNSRFIYNILKRPMYGKTAHAIVVKPNTKTNRKNCSRICTHTMVVSR